MTNAIYTNFINFTNNMSIEELEEMLPKFEKAYNVALKAWHDNYKAWAHGTEAISKYPAIRRNQLEWCIEIINETIEEKEAEEE